jgi:EAL domain-containing protein (putative c-di-GMP-specific phosphodiesterase class I)
MVKIDGSFVRDLAVNVDNQLYIRNLMGLAETFGLKTCAEFVENGEDAAFLVRAGVDYLQSYYFRPPRFHRPLAHRREDHAGGEELKRAQPG